MTNTQKEVTKWIDDELKNNSTGSFDGERLPALKLESGKITRFSVDISIPFNKWTGSDGVMKALIPTVHKTEKKTLWMNVKNPLYKQILERIKKGQTEFAVSATGSLKETRYTIVDDE